MPWAHKKLEWKIGEPDADKICDYNVRLMEMIFDRYTKRCGNPFCRWPISAIDKNFATPDVGEVCATCHDLYSALTIANLGLKNTMHFRAAHNEWKNENDPSKIKERRRRLGLDGGSDVT